MKFISILFTFISLLTSAFCEDLITVGCQAVGTTQLEAEIWAVKYAFIVSKDAEQLLLRSEEITNQNGQKYWVAELIIKVKVLDLEKLLPPDQKID